MTRKISKIYILSLNMLKVIQYLAGGSGLHVQIDSILSMILMVVSFSSLKFTISLLRPIILRSKDICLEGINYYRGCQLKKLKRGSQIKQLSGRT